MRTLILVLGILLLLAIEFFHIYFIMPFPGSQQSNTIGFAYWLENNINYVRILALLMVIFPAVYIFKHAKRWKKFALAIVFIFYGLVFYVFNFKFKADKMFYQPQNKTFAAAATNQVAADKLVLGIYLNGEAKAYPVQIIGYHHQVRDTVGGIPVMVTYCTVCRTGRVFSPVVNGKPENFRLVGMDHFNAMFEDATTKSWWQQATGVAVAGPLKGTALPEILSQQLTLSAWLRAWPNSLVMQPDTVFNKQYEGLAGFDKGTIKSSLEKRDSASWQFKSWVVGVAHRNTSRAYDWNMLVEKKLIQDSLPGLPLLVVLESDTASFHVLNRSVNGISLNFVEANSPDSLEDLNTNSSWTKNGFCVDGTLQGSRLQPVQASQEFWHSWETFHPHTSKYR